MKKLALAVAAVMIAALVWWISSDRAVPEFDRSSTEANDLEHATTSRIDARLDTPKQRAADEVRRNSEEAVIPTRLTDASGLVTGRVLWLPDRAPAVGIGVRIRSASYQLADGDPPLVVTNGEGRFRLEGIAIGPCSLELDRSEARTTMKVVAGENAEVVLESPLGVDVAGRVLDMHGEPRAGADIVLRELSWLCSRVVTVSGQDGSYRLTGLGRNTAIHARARGVAPSGQRTIDAKPGTTLTIDLHLGAAPGGIRGRVIDGVGRPLADAVVRFTPPSATGVDSLGEWLDLGPMPSCCTDQDGWFEAFDVPAGQIQLHVMRRGPAYSFATAVVEVRPARISSVIVLVPASGRAHGRVLAHDGSPRARVRVMANSIDGSARTSTRTGDAGEFEMNDAPAGRVRLSASDDAQDEMWAEFDLAAGAEIEWNPRFVALLPIRGRLVDAASRPIAAAMIQCEPGQKRAVTDGEGRFEIANMPSRPHVVRYATKDIYAIAEVVPSTSEFVLVAAPPNARITGRIVDAAGRALAGIGLRCADSRATSGADGTFELRDVRAGRHLVAAWKPKPVEVGSALVTLDIAANGVHDLGDVVFPEFGKLRVRGRSAEGVSLVWVRPLLRRVGETQWRTAAERSAVIGVWDFDAEPVGDYEIVATGGGAASELVRATIEAGVTTEIELEVRFGVTLRGELRSAEPQHESGKVEVRYEGRPPVAVASEDRKSTGRIATFSICILPGRHEVIATLPDGRSGSTTCLVPSDGSTPPIVSIELR